MTRLASIVALAAIAVTGCGRTGLAVLDGCAAGHASYCDGEVFVTCDAREARRDCAAEGLVCHPEQGCIECTPGELACRGEGVERCEGAAWVPAERCALDEGRLCRDAACVDACEEARANPSHLGCEHWAVDLDNFDALAIDREASAYPFGLVISNPWPVAVHVRVEQNDAPPGAPLEVRETDERWIPPLDHDVLELPRREVDGSHDGASTHTALTSRAYRVRSTLPVAIVQTNPLAGVPDTHSADTALLLPTEMLGERTTVVAWPQTLAHGETPETDLDPERDDEDQRAFLTIVGVADEPARVRVTLGELGSRGSVLPLGAGPPLGPGERIDVDLGAFDVLNLETRGLGADLTGTVVESDAPVAIFVGVEAADVPAFDTYAERICCADHLEVQLLPDRLAGRHFVVGRQHPRRPALARASGVEGPAIDEPEWVRLVAVRDAAITSDLPGAPTFLAARAGAMLRVDRSFELRVTNDGALHVVGALPSQNALGIDTRHPGGDPSLLVVPPVEMFSRVSRVVVPPVAAFDFVSVVAPLDATVLLDGAPLAEWLAPSGEAACRAEAASSEWIVHQCQLSFPSVDSRDAVEPGFQNDGGHLVVADRHVGISVSGFQAYVGYAHAGALREP